MEARTISILIPSCPDDDIELHVWGRKGGGGQEGGNPEAWGGWGMGSVQGELKGKEEGRIMGIWRLSFCNAMHNVEPLQYCDAQ